MEEFDDSIGVLPGTSDDMVALDQGGTTEEGQKVSLAPVTLYETRTGEPRQIHPWYVKDALKKRHKDPDHPELIGKPVFSRTPVARAPRQKHTCLLHPDRPERALYDSWGLPQCMTPHLASDFEVQRHMKNRHKSALETINAHRAEIERAEDRAERRAQTEALMALAAATQRQQEPVAVAAGKSKEA